MIVSYTQAQMSLALFLPTIILIALGMNFFKISYPFMGVMVLYTSYCYKRLFDISWGRMILKMLLFIVLAVIMMLVYGILLWIYWIVSGTIDLEEFIKAENAKKAVSYIVSSAKNWTS